jgi:hypothetical protein
MQQTQTQTDK